MPAMNSQTCAACTACKPKLVARQRVRWLRKAANFNRLPRPTPLLVSHVRHQLMAGRNRTFK